MSAAERTAAAMREGCRTKPSRKRRRALADVGARTAGRDDVATDRLCATERDGRLPRPHLEAIQRARRGFMRQPRRHRVVRAPVVRRPLASAAACSRCPRAGALVSRPDRVSGARGRRHSHRAQKRHRRRSSAAHWRSSNAATPWRHAGPWQAPHSGLVASCPTWEHGERPRQPTMETRL